MRLSVAYWDETVQMRSWLEYWNRPNGVFVSESHKRAYYRCIFSNVRPFLSSGSGSAMLDWGCGEAFAAERMAAECERVYLYDAADGVRLRLRERYKDNRRILVVDNDQLKGLPSECLDLILINSVIQYLSRAELIAALSQLRRLLKPGGQFLIGDVITPDAAPWQHVVVFLTFAYRHGFITSALVGLVRKFVPAYTSLKRGYGFSRYSQTELLRIFELCKLDGKRLPRNIAVSPIRSSYIVSKSI